jgi:hypothetical protein
MGTLNATFYITGVQLEKGSTATSFDYRPYGTELNLCQRYFYRTNPTNVGNLLGGLGGNLYTSTNGAMFMNNPVPMRAAPTLTRGGSNDTMYVAGINANATGTWQNITSGPLSVWVELISMSSGGAGYQVQYNGQLSANAEL